MIRKSILLPLCLLWPCVSCSVKENRVECPCVLDVVLSGGTESKVFLSVWNPGLRQSEDVDRDSDECHYTCIIPRDVMKMVAYSGLRHPLYEDGRLVLSKGEQMDELYAFCDNLDSRKENIFRKVHLAKQFALLHLRIECMSGNDPPSDVKISSGTAGVNLLTLASIPGEFSVNVTPVLNEYCRISLPRQYDNSLTLHIDGFDDIPIGESIVASGYDWSAASLEDIYLDVDVVRREMTIKITPWQHADVFSLIF